MALPTSLKLLVKRLSIEPHHRDDRNPRQSERYHVLKTSETDFRSLKLALTTKLAQCWTGPCKKKNVCRSGQVRSGQVRSGQVRSGQVRSGQVRSGKVRSGRVRSGQVRSGQELLMMGEILDPM